jgi:hypothetical protein
MTDKEEEEDRDRRSTAAHNMLPQQEESPHQQRHLFALEPSYRLSEPHAHHHEGELLSITERGYQYWRCFVAPAAGPANFASLG